ncbi:MAG: hypothetical protein JSV32_03860 [Dehalococcoidia bacterium]|nr:MAG: hypothetical protein JSV32_03860 [Dehalococcoidia bacterium]
MNNDCITNQCDIIAEVTGSNPVSPTISSVLSYALLKIELLVILLGFQDKG